MFLLNTDVNLAEKYERFGSEVIPKVVDSLHWFAPELQLAIFAIAVLLLDLFLPRKMSKHIAWLAIGGLIYAAATTFGLHHEEKKLFLGMIAIDSYSVFFKAFFLLGGIPFVLLSYVSKELENARMGEYYAILLATILGGMLMASANHILMAFMALELLSLGSYVLVGYHKRQNKSSEASLKYIIYGSVASAIMAYGLSILYGLSGSGEIPKILATLTADEGMGFAGFFALLLTFMGLAYKMATIPMHFWSPDVYEGAPTPITAFLSVASKAAGFALAMRLFGSFSLDVAPEAGGIDYSELWPIFLIVIAIVTMTLGNLAALTQTNVKRLFAYSSIAHAGYMMMGVVLLQIQGIEDQAAGFGISSVAYYLLAYLAMNLGAFAVVVLLENKTGSVELEEYAGLGWKAPFLGFSLVIFLFSLVGIPPTGGFMGKFQLIMAAVNSRGALPEGTEFLSAMILVMVAFALLNTAVSVYYYLKIIKTMFFSKIDTNAEKIAVPVLGSVVVALCLLLTIYLFVSASSLITETLHLEIYTGA